MHSFSELHDAKEDKNNDVNSTRDPASDQSVESINKALQNKKSAVEKFEVVQPHEIRVRLTSIDSTEDVTSANSSADINVSDRVLDIADDGDDDEDWDAKDTDRLLDPNGMHYSIDVDFSNNKNILKIFYDTLLVTMPL